MLLLYRSSNYSDEINIDCQNLKNATDNVIANTDDIHDGVYTEWYHAAVILRSFNDHVIVSHSYFVFRKWQYDECELYLIGKYRRKKQALVFK